MTPGRGHNGGPTMEPGYTWRKTAWTKARADLLPKLPIEILRRRVLRAKELGLDYTTYASVRASTGRDVIGFLFSNNALRVLRDGDQVPPERAAHLARAAACQIGVSHPPLSPEALTRAAPGLARVARAPGLGDSPAQTSDILRGLLAEAGLPGDGVLLLAETMLEAEWCALGRCAGVIGAERYFAAASRP